MNQYEVSLPFLLAVKVVVNAESRDEAEKLAVEAVRKVEEGNDMETYLIYCHNCKHELPVFKFLNTLPICVNTQDLDIGLIGGVKGIVLNDEGQLFSVGGAGGAVASTE